MNLRDLEYVVAVADLLHFGRAAERCHVSQPTLSVQVRKLEERLGVALFERTSKSVAVTPAGQAILRHARAVLDEVGAIEATAQAARDPLAGVVRIGAIPTLGPYLMPHILQPLMAAFPALRVIWSEDQTSTLLHRLETHAIDAALIAETPTQDDLAGQVLFEEPFCLAYPIGHRFERLAEIDEATLAVERMLLLAEGHCLRGQVARLCGAGSADGTDADLRATSLETLINLVASGFGCTLVPALAVRGAWAADLGVQMRKLALPGAARTISLVWRRTYPREATLRHVADEICRRLPDTVTIPSERR
jgi:LysR family hydrogen peroxide-inducible transcriptional activator